MAFKVDGEWWDIPDATKVFVRHSAAGRASLRCASPQKIGHRRYQREGRARWIHPFRPGVSFPTRKAARQAALRALAAGEAP